MQLATLQFEARLLKCIRMGIIIFKIFIWGVFGRELSKIWFIECISNGIVSPKNMYLYIALHTDELLRALTGDLMSRPDISMYWLTLTVWWLSGTCRMLDFRSRGCGFKPDRSPCPWARHFILCLVLVQLRKTDWKIIDWVANNQIKDTDGNLARYLEKMLISENAVAIKKVHVCKMTQHAENILLH